MSKIKYFLLGFLFISISSISYAQSRQDKTKEIIKKLNLVQNQKDYYNIQIEPLKYQASGNDSIRIVEIENELTDDKIEKRICLAFDKIFDDDDINNLYTFSQTKAFDKVFSGKSYKIISSEFQDVQNELKAITSNIEKQNEDTTEVRKEQKLPISVDRENGFYEVANLQSISYLENDSIELENKPALTFDEILKVEKSYENSKKPIIDITFTKEGANLFYILTKNNIGNPIAIVVNKQIISMPKVITDIMSGKVSISGNFNEKEADKIIKELRQK